MEKNNDVNMQRIYDYLDKVGAIYTVDKNPSQEKIDLIKAKILKNENLKTTTIDMAKAKGLNVFEGAVWIKKL